MQIVTRDVRNYITPEGRNPFRQWITQLSDKKARANVQRRIARLREGNFGDFIVKPKNNRALWKTQNTSSPLARFGTSPFHNV